MTRPYVFVSRRIAEQALTMLRESCDVKVWTEDRPTPREVLLREIAGCDGLLCMLTERIDAELLDAAPKLKVVSNMAVGYDNIDVAAATQRNIPVGNTPGVLTETTADFAFALLMAAARQVVEGEKFVRAGKWTTWDPNLFVGRDIHGATLGIIGFGRIGQAVARRARGFDMRVIYHDIADDEAAKQIGAEKRSFEEVLEAADFLSLHVPFKPETHHMMGTREFSIMKPTAILVNTARGGVVDPKALYHALKQGEIAYAALDVTEPEPIPPGDPLLTLDNCLIVPHIASASIATRTKMATMAAANALAGVKGERLPNCVNPTAYG